MKTMNEYFLTPSGLKVRLDLSYFILMATRLNDSTVENMVCAVEQKYLCPTALKWFAALVILLLCPQVSTVVFITIISALYLLGCAIRLVKPFSLVFNGIVHILYFSYSLLNLLFFIPHLIIIIVGVWRNIHLLIAFYIASTVLGIVTLGINQFVLYYTNKKYGIPLNDTELCAFSVFYLFLERKEKASKFISDYCKNHKSTL